MALLLEAKREDVKKEIHASNGHHLVSYDELENYTGAGAGEHIHPRPLSSLVLSYDFARYIKSGDRLN